MKLARVVQSYVRARQRRSIIDHYHDLSQRDPLVDQQFIIDRFHSILYDGLSWGETQWLGVTALKNPFDLLLFQEVLFDTRPTLIVETGTKRGGSAIYLASVCDLLGAGRVISIDRKKRDVPIHPRATFLAGRSSTDQLLVEEVRNAATGERVMVILDSDHTRDHVLEELDAYAPLVSDGCFLIVEDTNVNGHPVAPNHGPGPMEALNQWLPLHNEFERAGIEDRYLVSFNPGGYLRRRSVAAE